MYLLCTETESSGSAVQTMKFLGEALLMTEDNNISMLYMVSQLLCSLCMACL